MGNNKREYILRAYGEEHKITLRKTSYAIDGSLAIQMVCNDDGEPEPWDVLTTYIDGPIKPRKDCAYVQTDKYLDFIIENGIGEPTDILAQSGFNTYMLIKFNLDMLTNNEEE